MIDQAHTDGTPPRWYSVNNMGMATLCADQADAEMTANDCNIQWPRQAPHRAVQLVEASTLDTERTARIAAQVENEALKAERSRSGLAHRKAVQASVSEAVAAERKRITQWLEAQAEQKRRCYTATNDNAYLEASDVLDFAIREISRGQS